MLEEKIKDWLYEKHESNPYFDYDNVAKNMIELAEGMDENELDFEELYDETLKQLEDDGGMYPNGRDYDAEDEEGI